jgi:hypothetical protein
MLISLVGLSLAGLISHISRARLISDIGFISLFGHIGLVGCISHNSLPGIISLILFGLSIYWPFKLATQGVVIKLTSVTKFTNAAIWLLCCFSLVCEGELVVACAFAYQ